MAHANAVNSPLRKRERQRQPAPPGLPLSHTRDLPRPEGATKSPLADTDTTTAIYRYHCRYNSIATGPGLAWALSTCTSTPLVSPAVGFLFPPGRPRPSLDPGGNKATDLNRRGQTETTYFQVQHRVTGLVHLHREPHQRRSLPAYFPFFLIPLRNRSLCPIPYHCRPLHGASGL